MTPTACFVFSSRQNVFFSELLEALAEELARAGVAVERASDHFPAPRRETAYVCVPHELLPRLLPEELPSADQLRRTVTICTEQPGTSWFEEAAQAAASASCALDINRLGVEALRLRGVDARLLQLGYLPAWDRWRGELDSPRPVDVALLAGATPRRLTALARCADHLAGRRTELHLPEALVAHEAGSERFLAGARKWDLLARSRVLLNVHRGELGYFEWQRAVEAIVNGCVLLSEHSLGFEPLIPGEHFVSCSYDTLDVGLEGLLSDEERLARIRRSAYELLRDRHPLSASIGVLAEAVDEAARRPLLARTGARGAGEASSDASRAARAKEPQLPPPAWEPIDGQRAAQGSREADEGGSEDEPRARARARGELRERFGTRGASARVTALVCVGAGDAGVAAIEGLALGEYESLELVVVDRSGDRAVARGVRGALARAPWLSGELLTLSPAVREARARNRGLELAAGELLLIVDPETALYRRALTRLIDALDRAPAAAFAYGPVAVRGFERHESLVGYLSWEPYRLRYGSFIDGLALVRPDALLEAGGFATDRSLEGWEELALWCALADRAQVGVRVAEILAHRSRALPSRLSPADRDPAAAWGVLRERYACLSAPYAG